MEVNVYEYYDDYEEVWEEEPEENRMRVQYIVLGEIEPHLFGICYLGRLNVLAWIGKRTHAKAWTVTPIPMRQAREAVENAKKGERKTLDEYKAKYTDLMETTCPKYCSPGESRSTYDGMWGASFSWDNLCSYESQFAKEIEKKIRLYELRDEFLASQH